MSFCKRIALLCIVVLCTFCLGCPSKTNSRYTPESATARQAIDTALSRWKSGVKYGTITDTTRTVIVEEPRWKSGTRLENYEIGEEVLGQEYPRFKVKLNLAGKPEVLTEYLVIGVDPPIVYSKEEYELTSGKTTGKTSGM
jgi:hypothetical protein